MNLNSIQLPNFLIAELYKSSLVEIERIEIIEERTDIITIESKTPDVNTFSSEEANIKFLGENKKRVLVIVEDNNAAYINEDDLLFLTSILNACSLNLGDIAIVNTNIQAQTFNLLKQELSSKFVLLFGVAPGDIKLPFEIPHFQLQQYAGCTVVTAPKLSDLNNPAPEGKLLKTKLWLCLQRCFNL